MGQETAQTFGVDWAHFFSQVISFIIVAFVVFLISKAFLRPEPTPETKLCPFCKEANDPAASRCRACTSQI